MRLDLETEIRYPEGDRAGILRQVVLDENNEASAVVMSTEGLISRDCIVPIYLLSDGPGGVLTINSSPEEVDGLQSYEEERLPVIVDGWEFSEDAIPGGDVFPGIAYQPIVPVVDVANLPQGSIGLSQGTAIWCQDGPWGIVDEVIVDDNGQAFAFVGRPDNTEEHDRVLPIELIQEATPDSVVLNCTLADLPTYSQETILEHEEPERN